MRLGVLFVAVSVGVCALPRVAAAQLANAPAFGASDTSLDGLNQDLILRIDPPDLEWQIGALAFAGMDRGHAAVGLSAGAALVATGPKCRYVDVGVQGALNSSEATPLSGQAWASLCVSHTGLVDMHLSVGDRAILAVEPGLTARMLPFTGETSGNIFTFEWAPLGFTVSDRSSLDFWHFNMDFQLYWADEDNEDTFTGIFDLQFDMVRWWKAHPDENREVGFMHVDVQILGASENAGVIDIVPLRLSGVHAGGGLWDGWVAWTRAGNYQALPPGVPAEEQMPVWEMNTATGHLGGKWPRPPAATMGFDLDRDIWATLDRGLVTDSRLTGWVTWAGPTTLSLKGFLAFTGSYPLVGEATEIPTWGGEVRVGYSLGNGLTAAVNVEGAKRIEPDPTKSASVTEARIFAVLSTTYGKR